MTRLRLGAAWGRRHPIAASVLFLALLGLGIRHSWISSGPLVAGDLHWPDRARVMAWFPWATIWDPSFGFGQARFQEAFRSPIYLVAAIIARLGSDWSLAQRLLYFLPYAVLLPVAGWLLAREVGVRQRWALLSAPLLLGNTYFLIEGNGHVPLTLSAALGVLSLVCVIRALRRGSVAAALAAGLLVGVAAAYEVRPAYLTFVLATLYFLTLAVADPSPRRLFRRAGLAALAGAAFIVSQAYWWLPLLTYHGNAAFPIPPTPDFPVITLEHGLAGVHPYWTGGSTAMLVEAALNPMYLAMPLVAMTALCWRRLTPEIAWLALAGVLAAFLAKTDNPPLGQLYDWMYIHLPGWKLFREGSKFLFIVGIAYAVLVPYTLSRLWEARQHFGGRGWRISTPKAAVAVIVVLLAVQVAGVVTLESGALASASTPFPEPAAFSAIGNVLDADTTTGPALWLGAPVFTVDNRNHYFTMTSAHHSLFPLSGRWQASTQDRTDPFQSFCTDPVVPYCYLRPDLLAYVLRVSGARYLIAPQGAEVGKLPTGLERDWLVKQLTAALGPAKIYGQGVQAVAVWRLAGTASRVRSAPAVALVQSGPWTTAGALPALNALDIPVVYRRTANATFYPAGPATLPDSISVLPLVGAACTAPRPMSSLLVAQSDAPFLPVSVNGVGGRLPLVTQLKRSPGWSGYGPVRLQAGPNAVTDAAVPLGPCVEANPLSLAALAGTTATKGIPTKWSPQSENVKADAPGSSARWIELAFSYDPGWKLAGQAAAPGLHIVGDGFFNLYRVDRGAAGPISFQFSTRRWELLGLAVAGGGSLVFLAATALMWRRRQVLDMSSGPLWLGSGASQVLAGAGVVAVGFAAAGAASQWLGIPSAHPELAAGADPYGLTDQFGSLALLLLGLAWMLLPAGRIWQGTVGRVAVAAPPRRLIVTAAAGIMVLAAAACAVSTRADVASLPNVIAAGAPASTVAADSIDQAMLNRLLKDPQGCVAGYTQALKTGPVLPADYIGRGQCYMAINPPAAVHDLTQAISMSGPDPALFLTRAVAYRASGDEASAVRDYRQAMDVPSSQPADFLAAIDGLIATGDLSSAAAGYAAGSLRFPNSALLLCAGSDLKLAQDHDSLARAALDQALQAATQSQDKALVATRKADLEVRHLEYPAGAADATLAIQLSPASASVAYDDRSVAEAAVGDYTSARADLTRAIDSFVAGVGPYSQPTGVDGVGLARLYRARALIEYQVGDRHAALADLKEALKHLARPAADYRALLKEDILTASG